MQSFCLDQFFKRYLNQYYEVAYIRLISYKLMGSKGIEKKKLPLLLEP